MNHANAVCIRTRPLVLPGANISLLYDNITLKPRFLVALLGISRGTEMASGEHWRGFVEEACCSYYGLQGNPLGSKHRDSISQGRWDGA